MSRTGFALYYRTAMRHGRALMDCSCRVPCRDALPGRRSVSSSDGHRTLRPPCARRRRSPSTVCSTRRRRSRPGRRRFRPGRIHARGIPATEATEVHVAFDDESLYVGARCRRFRSVASRHRHPQGLRRRRAGHLRGAARHLRRSPQRLRLRHQRRRRRADSQMADEGRDVNPERTPCGRVGLADLGGGLDDRVPDPFQDAAFRTGRRPPVGLDFARRIRRKNRASTVAGGQCLQSRARVVGRHADRPAGTWRRAATSASSRSCSAARCGRSAAAASRRPQRRPRREGRSVAVAHTRCHHQSRLRAAEADEQQVNLTQVACSSRRGASSSSRTRRLLLRRHPGANQRQTSSLPPPRGRPVPLLQPRIGLTDAGAQMPLYGGLRVTAAPARSARHARHAERGHGRLGPGQTTAWPACAAISSAMPTSAPS